MPEVTVTRRLTFNAAHRIHNPELSDAENGALYGKCNNPNWHGHNYTLDVSVTGPVDPRTGLPVVAMVGGGQLARMTHQAGIGLGVEFSVLAASPTDSAGDVSVSSAPSGGRMYM